VREPLPHKPGTPARYDTEYERKGGCDLMMICEPKRGFRQVDITDQRTEIEFAQCMKAHCRYLSAGQRYSSGFG